MDWLKVFSILSSVVVVLVYLHNDLKKHIDKIEKQADRIEASSQHHIDKIEQEMREQAKRTDRLYEMFVDLLKNKNN